MLRWPRALWLSVALALALAAPSLGAALYCDDALMVARLEHAIPSPRPGALWLYTFAVGGPENTSPFWWGAPDLRISFFRPLASGLFSLEHQLFGRAALPYHLSSLAFLVASVFVVGLLHRRLLSERVGALAALLFAVAPAHAMAAAWPSARHVEMAATFGFVALLLHIRAREKSEAPIGAFLVMIIALLTSEVALAALGYVASYELFARDEPRASRMRALAPHGLLVAAYLVLYRAMGHGVKASGDYADPVQSPLAYLHNVPRHLGPLSFSQFFGVPSEASVAFPALWPVMLAVGGIATVGFGLLLRRGLRLADERDRRALRWLLPGALFALLPGLAGIVGDRALFVPGLGISAAVAIAIVNAARPNAAGERPVVARLGVGLLAVLQLGLAPLSFVAQTSSFAKSSNAGLLAVKTAELPKATEGKPGQVFGIGIADPSIGMYLQPIAIVGGGPVVDATMLTISLHDHVVRKTGDHSIEIDIVGGSLLENGFETVVRPSDLPLRSGAEVRVPGAIITVSKDDGRAPTALSVTFERALEDPSLAILVWQGGSLVRLRELGIGGEIVVKHEKGPSGF